MKAKAVVIGASAGGLEALKRILVQLREDFQLPLLIVQHISAHSDNYITVHLNNLCRIRVKEAEEKEQKVEEYLTKLEEIRKKLNL